MRSRDGRLALVFNGEIFNYVELRSELQALGHRFHSTGDTEVLLHAYEQWGRDCLPRLNGMWAFLIYNALTRTLFGSRDRFGVKPLYRYKTDDAVLFASEIKAIRASGLYRGGPNWRSVSRSLRRRLDLIADARETFYADIEHVPAGSAFELRPNGSYAEWRFWSLEELPDASIADPPTEFRELFEDAVRLRMRSDVPVGVSLSGGMDSTSIISVMATARAAAGATQPVQAFSFMSDEFDEAPYIRETLAKSGAELHRVDTDPRRLWDDLGRFLWFQDEPVHSLPGVIGFEIYRLAAENGVKVILCGQGADEVIAGYPNYFVDYWRWLLQCGRVRQLWREIDAYAEAHGRDRATLLRQAVRHFCARLLNRNRIGRALTSRLRQPPEPRMSAWFTPEVALAAEERVDDSDGTLETGLRWSVERAPLPLYLRVEDRNSMAHSVEARLPFLDYRLVTLVFQLAPEWKLRGQWNKYVLREAMRGCIPEAVRTRTDKMGFPIPAAGWFRTVLYEPIQDLLSSESMRSRGLYDISVIRKDFEKHRTGELDVTNELFTVAQLETWLTLDSHFAPADAGDGTTSRVFSVCSEAST